ncbi:MAG: hypothetical protein ACJ73S_29730 [Mycobacteriales bacterium]
MDEDFGREAGVNSALADLTFGEFEIWVDHRDPLTADRGDELIDQLQRGGVDGTGGACCRPGCGERRIDR